MALYHIRETLTEDRTYYVRTDGSDSNNGLTNDSAGAFLTIQKAVDVVCDELDPLGYAVTIQVGDGTYNESLKLRTVQGSQPVTINGNSATPSNVVVSSSTDRTITIKEAKSLWSIAGISISNTSSFCVNVVNSTVYIDNVIFNSASYGHIYAGWGALVEISSNYVIAGGAGSHIAVSNNSVVRIVPGTVVTLTGSPAFTNFISADCCASVYMGNSISFSGSATGSRYRCRSNSVIDTGGAGASYLPGSSAGSISSGGQYI